MPFQDLFKEVHNIPSIPKVVQELITNLNDDSGNIDDIAKKIQLDQSLSLKILRLANSARYGSGRKINSIDAAVVMLGMDVLKTLIIASGVTSACKSIPGVDQKQFWRCSFSVASICKLIAKQAKKDPELAFTCGLLHNIGDTLMYIAHTDKMVRIDALVNNGANRAELQQNQFGYDYMQAGAELVNRWNFPNEISEAIGFQNRPNEIFDENPYALIVNISATLYHQFEANKSKEDMLSKLPSEKLQALNVDLLELLEKLVDLFEQDDDIHEFLS